MFSIGNHGVGFCQINCGAVDLWAWDNSCAWIPPTHLSAALQIVSDVGVRSLCIWKWTSSVTTLDPNQSCSGMTKYRNERSFRERTGGEGSEDSCQVDLQEMEKHK